MKCLLLWRCVEMHVLILKVLCLHSQMNLAAVFSVNGLKNFYFTLSTKGHINLLSNQDYLLTLWIIIWVCLFRTSSCIKCLTNRSLQQGKEWGWLLKVMNGELAWIMVESYGLPLFPFCFYFLLTLLSVSFQFLLSNVVNCVLVYSVFLFVCFIPTILHLKLIY